MTDLKTLEAAWNKALANGFTPLDRKHLIVSNNMDTAYGYESWLYDHDFAKALWGDSRMVATFINLRTGQVVQEDRPEYPTVESTPKDCQILDYFELEPWKYHLQQMVVAEDTIKYLGDHI